MTDNHTDHHKVDKTPHHKHHHHDTSDPAKLARKLAILDDPARRAKMPPEQLLDLLPLPENGSLLDLGAGSGFLTLPAAKATSGTVYALDLDANLLSVIAARAQEAGLANLKTLQNSCDNVPLAADSLDAVTALLLLHEVDSLTVTLAESYRLLKSGGHFLALEYEATEEKDAEGPPPEIRISSAQMQQALQNCGFSIVKKTYIYQELIYVVVARKL